MKNILIIAGLVLLLLFGAILYFNRSSLPGNTDTEQSQEEGTVKIKGQSYKVEVARSPQETQVGLSDKESLPKDQGMLFVFEKPDVYSFWMRNMDFPIDIIFIRDNKIVTIHQNVKPPQSEDEANIPIYRPDQPADRVLEVSAGEAKEHGFKKGDTVEITI